MSKKLTKKKINIEIPESGITPGGVYDNPMSDSGFKKLLCSEKSLVDFLNGCMHLDEAHSIKSLTFKTKRITYRTSDKKERESETWTFDIRAKTQDDRAIDVEVQNLHHDFFIDRVLTYGSALMLKAKAELDKDRKEEFEQNKTDSEEKFRRTYEIPETVCIWVCNFVLPQAPKRVWDSWMLYSEGDLNEGKVLPMTDRFKYIIIQLPNFKKRADELTGSEDQWLYILKHAFESTAEIEVSNDAVKEALERIKFSEDDKEANTITQREYNCTIASAMHEAREQARTEFAATIANLQEKNENLQAESKAKDKDLASKEATIADKDAKIEFQAAEIARIMARNAELEAALAAKQH